jgi:hypothetical protein
MYIREEKRKIVRTKHAFSNWKKKCKDLINKLTYLKYPYLTEG